MKLFRFTGTRNAATNLSRSSSTPETIPVQHVPVMAKEIVEAMQPRDGQRFIDATFGGGGHTRRLLATGQKITVFALDRDPEAFQRATALSRQIPAESGQRVIPLLGRFSQLPSLLERLKIPKNSFDGAIMDLGASSQQYETDRRGFSIRLDGPLDMRMDGNRFEQMPTAADVVNSLGAEELARIFKAYGEEKNAMKIAQAIVDSRFMMKRLNTTGELAELISQIRDGRSHQHDKLGRAAHPATKVFQALRIFVNNELNELNYAVQVLRPYLKVDQTPDYDDDDDQLVTEKRNDGGLLAIISFHSLEDKIVKGHFIGQDPAVERRRMDEHFIYGPIPEKSKKFWRFYRKRLMIPAEEEIIANPRARSAKLRIGLRIA